jgi:hypothetical protein
MILVIFLICVIRVSYVSSVPFVLCVPSVPFVFRVSSVSQKGFTAVIAAKTIFL